MDSITLIRITTTVVSFLCFIAWIAWFMERDTKDKYQRFAQDLLEDDDTTPSPVDATKK